MDLSHNCHGSATAVYTCCGAIQLHQLPDSCSGFDFALGSPHHTCSQSGLETLIEGMFAGQVHTSPVHTRLVWICCLAANLCPRFPLTLRGVVAEVQHMSYQKVHSVPAQGGR